MIVKADGSFAALFGIHVAGSTPHFHRAPEHWNTAQWANQGFLSNGYIIKYFLKFLKNILMLTKIFEETLPWLVKILKTDQQ